MAIHVALLDIHPADRKHLERLLERECDVRKKDSEYIYVDSFGSVEAMLKVPMKYDLFMVDAVDIMLHPTGKINLEVAQMIRDKGVDAPVALLFPEDIAGPVSTSGKLIKSIRKPVTQNLIGKILDWALESKDQRKAKIELRGDFETYYVTIDEIIYATGDNNNVRVYLTENRDVNILEDIVELSVYLSDYECILDVGRNAIVNMDKIIECEERAFTLEGGDMVTFSMFDAPNVSEAYYSYVERNR